MLCNEIDKIYEVNIMLSSKAKIAKFHYELNLIKDKKLKLFAAKALLELPDYFYIIPASSSGKYHPKHALGEEGLVKHTQCAVRIAEALFTISNFDKHSEDMIVVALLLHDGCKKGVKEDKHTKHEHPNIIATFLENNINLKTIIEEGDLTTICNAIRSHMGQWNMNRYSQTILKTPTTTIEKFVHMCDYLASRKFLNMDISY